MTRAELVELIRNGENSGVEFKRDSLDNRALAREIVALANLKGGRVVLGVEEDGRVSGLTRQDPDGPTYRRLEEWVMQACRDKIRPELIPYFEVIRDAEAGQDVAVVSVEPGWDVHHLWHDHHRTYYLRVGSLTREASPEELQRLFQQRGVLRPELRPVSGSDFEDLDVRRLRDYFGRIRQQGALPEDPTAWAKLLVNTEILDHHGDRSPSTVAGMLLFGKNPNRFLPQAGMDAACYPGVEKDYHALERSALRGPLTPLLEEGAQEGGVVEQAMDFVRRHTHVATVMADEVRRVERWAYPLEAVREALVNALVHRDYLLSATDVELSLYSDRLEIISPGRLPNGVTPERMKVGVRAARNQMLKEIMRDYGYLEHQGMGVPRKIVAGMRAHNGTEPDLVEEEERFLVRLWR